MGEHDQNEKDGSTTLPHPGPGHEPDFASGGGAFHGVPCFTQKVRDTAMVRNAIVASGILPDLEGAHPAARNSRPNYLWRPKVPSGSVLRKVSSAGLEATARRQAGCPPPQSLFSG